MSDQSFTTTFSVDQTPEEAFGATDTPGVPVVAGRAAFQAELDALRVRGKAHTREGDAIAAARRRLPMVEVDPAITLTGPHGPVTLAEVFEGRRQLIACFHMWRAGRPAAAQREGCTFYTGQVRELSCLHSRDITYATFCPGPYGQSARYRDFTGWEVPRHSAQDFAAALLAGRRPGMVCLVCYLRHRGRVFETYWTSGRGAEAMGYSYALPDRTVYGRQEAWEDSPAGWPQRWDITGEQVHTNGRPTAHWPRLQAGHSDDPGTAGRAADPSICGPSRWYRHYRCFTSVNTPVRNGRNRMSAGDRGRVFRTVQLRHGQTAASAAALTATLGLAAASWVVAVRQMSGMDMGVATRLGSFAFFAAVWVPMMAAMMLPGAAPAVLRRAHASGGVRAVPLFAGCYLAVWALVGAAVYALDRPHGSVAAGAVVIAAGVYEVTPLKRRLRRRCRRAPALDSGLGCAAPGRASG